VEIAGCSALGAQLFRGSWTETHPFPVIFLICTFPPSLPPAHPTLKFHVLDYPVVRHSLDFNAMLEVINGYSIKFSHFHHSTVLGSLRSIWSFRLFVGVETTEDVKASSKTREVRIHNRVPFAKIHPHAKVSVPVSVPALHPSNRHGYKDCQAPHVTVHGDRGVP